MSNFIDMSRIILPRVPVRIKHLTLGIENDTKDQELGIRPDTTLLLTSIGDIEILSLVHGQIIAGAGLLNIPGRDIDSPVRVHVVHPAMYPCINIVKRSIEHRARNRSVMNRLSIRYMPVRDEKELFTSTEFIPDCDVHFTLYPDFYLDDTRKRVAYFESLNAKKSGKIVIINRFDRRTKSITGKGDVNVTVQCDRSNYFQGNLQDDINYTMVGKIVGFVKLTGYLNGTISKQVIYPCTFI